MTVTERVVIVLILAAVWAAGTLSLVLGMALIFEGRWLPWSVASVVLSVSAVVGANVGVWAVADPLPRGPQGWRQ